MKVLLYISFFFWISWSLSQSPSVLLEVSNLQPKVGEYITVQMSSNVGSNFEMNFPDEFQSGMNVMSGMRQKYVNGRSSTVYYQTLSGFFMEPGSYDFGPVKVKIKKKSYKSKLIQSENYLVQIEQVKHIMVKLIKFVEKYKQLKYHV